VEFELALLVPGAGVAGEPAVDVLDRAPCDTPDAGMAPGDALDAARAPDDGAPATVEVDVAVLDWSVGGAGSRSALVGVLAGGAGVGVVVEGPSAAGVLSGVVAVAWLAAEPIGAP
jgi:hypothetical protein